MKEVHLESGASLSLISDKVVISSFPRGEEALLSMLESSKAEAVRDLACDVTQFCEWW